ncbi:MAG: (2Fe-2S)-binding protein [Planctomycetaceae bacterium]|nr:(2Fe-2S)-binding protein [Planctomycetaceae bacterium]
MPTVKFTNEKRSIDVPEGANLRKEAMKNGVELYSGPHRYFNCRGNGLCCSCRVYVKGGSENVSRRGFWEWLNTWIHPLGFFTRIGHEKEMRLACQTRVYGDCEIEARPEMNLHGEKFWN